MQNVDVAAPVQLSRREEARALMTLAFPVIGAQIAQMSMGFVDTLLAGHLGQEALAAVGLGCALWMPYLLLFIGTLLAVSPNVAQRFGAGKYLDIGHQVRQGLWLAALSGIAACLIVQVGAPYLLNILGDTSLSRITVGFLKGIAWGLPALSGMTVLRCYTESVSRTRPVLLVSALGLIVNASLAWILMYGKFGLPQFGAVGCGWASATTSWLMFLSLGAYVLKHPAYHPYETFHRYAGPDWREMGSLLKLGLPIGVTMLLEGGMCLMVALGMQRISEEALAANQIALNVSGLTFMIPLGIHTAIAVRVGQAVGAGRIAAARQSGFVGMGLAMACMAGSGLILFVAPSAIAHMYTHEVAVVAVAIPLLQRAALFQLADGLQVASHGALRGAKETLIPTLITVIAYWVVGIPLGYTLAFNLGMGANGIWNGLVMGLVVAAGLLCWRFVHVIRKLEQTAGSGNVERQESAADCAA